MRRIGQTFAGRLAIALILIVLMLAGAYYSYSSRADAQPAQPMPFPHVRMVGAGVPCLYCHTDAPRSQTAGLPSVEKCMGCHRVIAANTAPIQQLTTYWQQKQPIPWVRVAWVPEFVHFSHEVHIASGLNCERCHGNVGAMDVTHQVTVMNMGWCLTCHRQQANAQQLMDCSICHF